MVETHQVSQANPATLRPKTTSLKPLKGLTPKDKLSAQSLPPQSVARTTLLSKLHGKSTTT
jgi:hypothetical protein